MSDRQLFGVDWISASVIEDWIEETLRDFLPDYLGRMERQSGRADQDRNMPMPKTWGRENVFDNFPDESILPAIIIISPGLADRPTKLDNVYRAKWAVGVGIVGGANTPTNTNSFVKDYAALVRALLVNHPSLLGRASGCDWVDERYDDESSEEGDTVAVARLMFEVSVDRVVSYAAGPRVPSQEPAEEPEDWPVVQTVHLELQTATVEE